MRRLAAYCRMSLLYPTYNMRLASSDIRRRHTTYCRTGISRDNGPRSGPSVIPEHIRATTILPPPTTGFSSRRSPRGSPTIR